MKNLLTAIINKLAASTVYTDVGGRIYLDEYPVSEGPPVFPYIVFFVVSASQNDTFKTQLDDVMIQFSIFSADQSVTEISGIYSDLKSAMDDAVLTVSGETVVWMIRENFVTSIENITTADATDGVKHWSVDYSVMVER